MFRFLFLLPLDYLQVVEELYHVRGLFPFPLLFDYIYLPCANFHRQLSWKYIMNLSSSVCVCVCVYPLDSQGAFWLSVPCF